MEWIQQNISYIIIAIFIVAFIFKGKVIGMIFGVESISVSELKSRMNSQEELVLIDVRTESEFRAQHVKGAILMPLSEIDTRIPKLKAKYKKSQIAVICQSGNRSTMGAVKLVKGGLEKVYNVQGGMMAWRGQDFPTM